MFPIFFVILQSTMVKSTKIEQMLAFARIDGALVALMWIASFACFVGQFQYQALSSLAFLIGAVSLVFASMRVKKFRDKVFDGTIAFWQALFYSVTIYLYSSLLFAMAQFIYFQFLDNGSMLSHYYNMASTPEFKQVMNMYGLTKDDWQVAIDNIAALKPIEIAFQFFTTNIIMGTVMSVPVAAIFTRNKKRDNNRWTYQ